MSSLLFDHAPAAGGVLRRRAPAVAPPIVHDVLRSPGRALDAAARAELEPGFGHSFADVRVHTGGRAAESARAVGARAYAAGRDVVFGAGRYAPATGDGRRLIAHELAHGVQEEEPATPPEGPEPPPAGPRAAPRPRASIGGGYNLFRSARGPAEGVAPPVVHQVLASSGEPLDATVRGEMEPRFGHSFADVRVHADASAAESARAVGAHAYAVGRDVVFGAGRYAPATGDGKRLIAHELAHVVQQRGAAPPSLQPALEIGAANDPAEREAEQAAAAAARGWQPRLDGVTAGGSAAAAAGLPVLRRSWWGGILGALGGAALGAGVGMAVGGPVGAVIGGVLGGLGGLVAGDVASARRRRLSDAENSAAKQVFGPSLDTEPVRILASPVMSVGGYVRTVGDHIHISPSDYPDKLSVGFIVHELTHVWQKQHGISFASRLFNAIRGKYEYGGEQALLDAQAAGKHFRDFNTEQQGDILQHYYERLSSGGNVSAWLPFVEEVWNT